MLSAPTDAFVSANGLRFHYRRWSPAAIDAALPPILLLHGLASSSHIWNFTAPLLAARGHSVVAVDQRGHGESDKPATGYDFASILADDEALVSALGLRRPLVVGHSWGAMAALQYAAEQKNALAGLVLVDGAVAQFSLWPGWSLEQALKDLAPPRFAGTPRETFLTYYRQSPLGMQWTPELEETVLHLVDLRPDDTVAPYLAFENHLQIIEAMWHQETFALYSRARCPIKLIVAENAPTSPTAEKMIQMRGQALASLRALHPAIQIVVMPDTMHDIPLQRPAQLAEEILLYATPQT